MPDEESKGGLMLTRKVGQTVVIHTGAGETVHLQIAAILSGNQVRLRINGPRTVNFARAERPDLFQPKPEEPCVECALCEDCYNEKFKCGAV